MKTLNLDQMEQINASGCGGAIFGTFVGLVGLVAASATVAGAGVGLFFYGVSIVDAFVQCS